MYSFSKVVTTTWDFFTVRYNPAALRFEKTVGGQKINGYIRRGPFEKALKAFKRNKEVSLGDLVDSWMTAQPGPDARGGLQDNAWFWLVPKTILSEPEVDPFDLFNSHHDQIENSDYIDPQVELGSFLVEH